MIRSLTLIPAMLCAAALVSAQAPAPGGAKPGQDKPSSPPPSTQSPSTPSSQSSKAGQQTYTGCLKPGSTPGSWVLENAQASTAGAGKSDTVGTSGTTKTINLNAKSESELKPHANHKVEVSGSLAPAKSGGAAGGASAGQELTVESVKMVSATCP